MMLGEQQRLHGILFIEVIDAAGAIVETRRVPNLITTAGKELLAKLLMGKVGAVPSGWAIVVGVGDATPQASDTQLGSYVDRATATTEVTIGAANPGSAIVATVKARLEALAPGTTPQPLAEAGIAILTGTATETLFNRVQFAPVNRGPAMVLNLAWEITF